jgi:hypothetical protein
VPAAQTFPFGSSARGACAKMGAEVVAVQLPVERS